MYQRIRKSSFKKTIDILRNRPVWDKFKTIFIHIPKSAGVSVNKAIYGKTLGHFYASEIQKVTPNLFKNSFKFAVVRHPVDRLFSAYSFAKTGGTKEMRMHNENYYRSHKDFKSFESFVLNWLTAQNLSKIDGVFRPQHLYIFDTKEKLIIDKFFKLETIEQNKYEISKKIGKDFILRKLNKTSTVRPKIPDEIKHKIYELYERDFTLLKYKL